MSKNQRPKILRMDLHHEGNHVEVTWRHMGDAPSDVEGAEGYQWPGYYVSSQTIDGLGKMIREHLQALQGVDWNLTDLNASSEAYAPILADLVGAGQSLHAAILRGVEGDELSEQRATVFRKWFDKNVRDKSGWRIEVVHASFSKQIAPWALACAPIARDQLAAVDFQDAAALPFWGTRFKLAVRGVSNEPEVEEDRDGSQMGLACVLELGATMVMEIEDKWDVAEKEGFRNHIRWDRAGFNELAKAYIREDIFWYVSLRADGGSFRIGDQYIKPIDLDLNKPRARGPDDEKRVVLMLLDGDAVIRHDRGADWLKRALELGRSGLIAVEADIRNTQVRHFGWKILKYILLSKLPLLEAMSAARREFWPLGLLYGVYCSPLHVAITPPPEDRIENVDKWLSKVRAIETAEGEA